MTFVNIYFTVFQVYIFLIPSRMSSIENKTVDDFKKAVTDETTRLLNMCSDWRNLLDDKSSQKDGITEEIIGDIYVAVG